MIRSVFIAALFGVGLWVSGCAPAKPSADAAAPAAEAAPILQIEDPWAAVTPGGASVAAGFVAIANSGGGDVLLGAESARAGRTEIHEMTAEGDVMRMRKVDSLEVPAGDVVKLSAGGAHHLMFFDITAPFEAGQTVPVTLVFQKAGRVDAAFTVRPRNASGDNGGHAGHEGHKTP